MKRRLIFAGMLVGVSAVIAAYYVGMHSTPPVTGVSEKKEPHLSPEESAIALSDFTLSNGMRVVVVTDTRVPAISHMLWLKVGSADDPLGKSGLAHYLEHLMFKGSKHMKSGEYSATIERLGGEHNAFTSYDFTGYYVQIAKEHLETVMRLEAERFQHLNPSITEYDEERDVILEERSLRTDNNPAGLFSEQMQATLFQHHPYRIPVIGWRHEMEALTLDDAMAFYRRFYHPANLTLIVTGDVTAEQVRTLAEQYYGPMDSGEKYVRNWVQDPPSFSRRDLEFRHPLVQQSRWMREYKAPSLGSDESHHALPLMLLAHILGGSETSILYRTLVEEQPLASDVSVYYSGWQTGPGTLTIQVTPIHTDDLETIEQIINKTISKISSSSIDKDALERTKTQYKAASLFAQEGLMSSAMILGQLIMLDASLDYYTAWAQKIEAVTGTELMQAAQRVFRPENAVSGTMLRSAGAKP